MPLLTVPAGFVLDHLPIGLTFMGPRLSEGTLITTVVPERADAYLRALADAEIDASIVGEILDPEAGRTIVRAGVEQPLPHPGVDPFWRAFASWASA